MRLWHGILASIAVHAGLLQIPIGLSASREPECVEVQFVLEVAPAPSRPPEPAPIASVTPPLLPQIAVPPPVVDPVPQKKPVVRPRPEPKRSPPKAAPTPPVKEAPPAEMEMPLPSPAANEPAEPEPPHTAAPAPAPKLAALPATERPPAPAVLGTSGAPEFLKRVLPRYPRLAREMGREGTVVLALAIGEDGRLEDVEILESAGADFDEEALRAVRASSFRPAVRDGRAVACRAILPVKFVLKGATHD